MVVALSVIVLVAAITAYWAFSTRAAQEKSHKTEYSKFAGSPLISFSENDISVSTDWNLLSGRHPRATFRMKADDELKKIKNAVFLYRPVGAGEWHSVNVRMKKGNTSSLTLRDLKRNTRYECLFAVRCQDTTLCGSSVSFVIE